MLYSFFLRELRVGYEAKILFFIQNIFFLKNKLNEKTTLLEFLFKQFFFYLNFVHKQVFNVLKYSETLYIYINQRTSFYFYKHSVYSSMQKLKLNKFYC